MDFETKEMTITLCPDCKKYIGAHYDYCPYCGLYLKDIELLTKKIEVAK